MQRCGSEGHVIQGDCDIDRIPRGPQFTKDFWQAEVTKMIKVYGAPIDDSDASKIVDYLAATY